MSKTRTTPTKAPTSPAATECGGVLAYEQVGGIMVTREDGGRRLVYRSRCTRCGLESEHPNPAKTCRAITTAPRVEVQRATKHPNQPVVVDPKGVLRFRQNAIVRWLVDQQPQCLNRIAMMDFSREDREQLAMLIGYSVSGAGDLDYMSDECLAEAEASSPAAPRP